jgi:hypothetical protein
MQLPTEIINHILSFRPKHPTAKIIEDAKWKVIITFRYAFSEDLEPSVVLYADGNCNIRFDNKIITEEEAKKMCNNLLTSMVWDLIKGESIIYDYWELDEDE